MSDKKEFVVLAIVAIVAVVGLVMMFINTQRNTIATTQPITMSQSPGETGNIGGQAFQMGLRDDGIYSGGYGGSYYPGYNYYPSCMNGCLNQAMTFDSHPGNELEWCDNFCRQF